GPAAMPAARRRRRAGLHRGDGRAALQPGHAAGVPLGMTRVVMLALLALVAAGLLGIAQQGRESGTRGFDEIAYGSLQPDVLQPGQGMSQGSDVQAPQLSQLAFLYSFAVPC